MGVDDRDDLASANGRWLLEVHVIKITGNAGVNIRIGRCGRQRNRWGDLLNRLDLMLERGGVRRATGERRPI